MPNAWHDGVNAGEFEVPRRIPKWECKVWLKGGYRSDFYVRGEDMHYAITSACNGIAEFTTWDQVETFEVTRY